MAPNLISCGASATKRAQSERCTGVWFTVASFLRGRIGAATLATGLVRIGGSTPRSGGGGSSNETGCPNRDLPIVLKRGTPAGLCH
ncbi:hypothetical protein GCM10022376_27490 [Yimella lutea]